LDHPDKQIIWEEKIMIKRKFINIRNCLRISLLLITTVTVAGCFYMPTINGRVIKVSQYDDPEMNGGLILDLNTGSLQE